MSDDDARPVALASLWLGAAVALSPLPPATDWPQHLALASLWQRIAQGEPAVVERFAANAATHNAGVHLLLAASGLDPALGGRLLLGLYPPLLLGAAALLLRRQGLPAARALWLVPAVLGFSFGWGLINFCLGTALAWLLVAGVLEQARAPRPGRALLLLVGSLALGVTHVMAMLLGSLVAAAAGLEACARGRARIGPTAAAGALLLPGCLYDLRVYFLHTAADAAAYATPAGSVDEPTLLRKLGLLGALLSGLFTTYADTALAWVVVAALGALAWQSRGRAPRLVAPLGLLAALYALTPSVVFNTHLVFQRLPQWMLLGALLALPPLPAALEARARRAALALAALYLALVPPHLALHHREARGALDVLASLPRGASLTGVVEEPRTLGVRMHTLTHAAALGVVRGAADEACSFARWMGLPVVYKPAHRPPYASWEHDGWLYDPASPAAQRYPFVLLRTAWADEPTEHITLRLFGSRSEQARVLARSKSWLLIDAREALGAGR